MTRAAHDDTILAAAATATHTPQSEAGFPITPPRLRLRSKPVPDEPAHGDPTPAVASPGLRTLKNENCTATTRTLKSGNCMGKRGFTLRRVSPARINLWSSHA